MAKAVDRATFAGMAEQLAKTMSKRFKDGPVGIVKHAEDNFSAVTDWVSSGCQMLDLAMSNRPDGGFPCGRISVLYGPEQSGKSLVAAHALANTQKAGGIAIFIDAESGMSENFFNAIGVNTMATDGTWQLVLDNRLEVIFSVIEQYILDIRQIDKKVPITIVLDSYAGCITEEDNAGDFSLKGYNTAKARIMSDALGRLTMLIARDNVIMIITNQVKYHMNAQPFQSPWRMPGGQSLPHFASIIIQLKKSKEIFATINNIKRPIGRIGIAIVEKNRLGPPHVKVNFTLYYDRGIDNLSSYIEYMDIFGIGKKSGAWIEYNTVDKSTGEQIKIRENGTISFVSKLKQYPYAINEIWEQICDKFIMAYSTSSDQLDHTQFTIEDAVEGSIVDVDEPEKEAATIDD